MLQIGFFGFMALGAVVVAAAAWLVGGDPFAWAYRQAQRGVDFIYFDIVAARIWPPLHKVLVLLSRPGELGPLAQMALAAKAAQRLPQEPNLAFCYDILNKVSRSFAVVIQQLPMQMRDPVCVFYLVLRALDTVEDDMAIEDEVKLPLLRSFHEKCFDREWSMTCGAGNYVRLMQQYPRVVEVFLGLEKQYQKVIVDITRRMGAGMAEFIEKDVVTVAEYEKYCCYVADVVGICLSKLYCHYVAGLVGIGLSDLWAVSGIEGPEFAGEEVLSNHMGLFLQKTNIIRDYLEDINEEPAPRMFWPKEIWGKHAADLAAFKDKANAPAAVACLNEMVTDALQHVPHCLQYLERLHDWNIFRFCAIPQVMAIGTLGLCYANPGVFTGVVKMRRGLTAKYMAQLVSMREVYEVFDGWAAEIDAKAQRIQLGHREQVVAVAKLTAGEAAAIRRLCQAGIAKCPPRNRSAWAVVMKLVTKFYFNAGAVALIGYLVVRFFEIDIFSGTSPLDSANMDAAAL